MERRKRALRHFVAKDGIDIEGMGTKIVSALVDEGLAAEPADLYRLDRETLAAMERLGEKSADNLVRATGKRRRVPLPRFFFALWIPPVGEHIAEVLARHFGSLEALRGADGEELRKVREVGPEVAASVRSYFDSPRNAKAVDRLLREVKPLPPAARAGKASGKTFLFTGTLSVPRARAQEMVRREGGSVAAGISGKVDYLVAGEDPGSKLAARELGVPVLTSGGGHEDATARRGIRFPAKGSVDTPGHARSCRAWMGGVRRQDRDEGHVKLGPDFDLVVLAALRAAFSVQDSSLQRLPLIAGPRSPWLAPLGRRSSLTANPGSPHRLPNRRPQIADHGACARASLAAPPPDGGFGTATIPRVSPGFRAGAD